jgi:hypothetical protein
MFGVFAGCNKHNIFLMFTLHCSLFLLPHPELFAIPTDSYKVTLSAIPSAIRCHCHYWLAVVLYMMCSPIPREPLRLHLRPLIFAFSHFPDFCQFLIFHMPANGERISSFPFYSRQQLKNENCVSSLLTHRYRPSVTGTLRS